MTTNVQEYLNKNIKKIPIAFVTQEAASFHVSNQKIQSLTMRPSRVQPTARVKEENDGYHYITISNITNEDVERIKKSIVENLREGDIPSISGNDSDTGSQVNSSNGDSDSPGKGPEKEDIEVQTAPVAQATKDAAAEAKAIEDAAKAAAEAKAIEDAAKAAAEAKAIEDAAKAAAEAKAIEEAAKAAAEAKAVEDAAEDAAKAAAEAKAIEDAAKAAAEAKAIEEAAKAAAEAKAIEDAAKAAAEAKAVEDAAKAAAEAKAIEEAAKAAAEAKAIEDAAKAAAEAKAIEDAAKAAAEAKAIEDAAKEAQLKTVSPIRRYPNENMSSQNRWLWVKNIVSKITQKFGAKGVTALAANDKDNNLYVCVSGATAEQIDEINRIFNEEPTPTEDLEPADQQSNWFIIRQCMNVYGDEKFRHRITQLIFALLMVAAALALASFLVMHFSPAAMTVALPVVAHAIAGLTPMAFNAILGVAAGVFAVSTALLITSGFARYQYGKPANGFAGKNRPTVDENATASNHGMFASSSNNAKQQSSIFSSMNPMNWTIPGFGSSK